MKKLGSIPVPELMEHYSAQGANADEMMGILEDILTENGLEEILTEGCLDPDQAFQARAQVLPLVLSLLNKSDEVDTDDEAHELIRQANEGLMALANDIFKQARKRCNLCLQECSYRTKEAGINAIHNVNKELFIDQYEVTLDDGDLKETQEATSSDDIKINWFGENN